MEQHNQAKLWTRDFSILTVGTIISICGNTLAGFSINLLVLDYSDSVFLFVLYLVIFNIPKVIVPMIAGPFLDTFSRRKTIYTLDFISTAIYISLFLILGGGYFNYIFLLAMSLALGTIDSFYHVAYESLYPLLVAEGNFRKAYSVSSAIMPLSAVMLPVATWLYDQVGIGRIFLFASVAFLTAACFETRIRADETHLRKSTEKYSISEFKSSFVEGVKYIWGEKGLLVITGYFCISTLSWASGNLYLPYFRSQPHLGTMLYSLVMSGGVIGRFLGGLVQYRLDYPTNKKFMIAMIVYVTISVIEMGILFTPVYMIAVMCFLVGLLGVTSYNIRVSATQSYLPDAKRARFNGAFAMFMNVGMIVGQLVGGALADHIPIRAVVVLFNGIGLIAAFAIMWRGRRHVIPIYNRVV